MKKICFFIIVSSACILCHAQKAGILLDSKPLIYYYLYTDEDVFSYELVLLCPDSSFYFEKGAPMMLQYTEGRYTCHGDSLFFTSYQKLDTLDILKVEEFRNPAAPYTTIAVVSEKNQFNYSGFIINGASDTLWVDSSWILKYDGKVNEIAFTVGDVSHFSRYFVNSSRNNVFLIQVNSEEMHAEAVGVDIIFENQLFVKRERSLFDTLLEDELNIQTNIPQGVSFWLYQMQPNNFPK